MTRPRCYFCGLTTRTPKALWQRTPETPNEYICHYCWTPGMREGLKSYTIVRSWRNLWGLIGK